MKINGRNESISINSFEYAGQQIKTLNTSSWVSSLSGAFLLLSSSVAQNVSGNINFYGSLNIGFTGSSTVSASIVPLSIMSQQNTNASLYITGQTNTERIHIESYSNSGISGGFAQA